VTTKGEQRTIVVIDDEGEIRRVLVALLTSGGYHVVETGDPTQAVRVVREAQPALVLCDITMPQLDGYGVLRSLQADPDTAHYPVVFITAHREFSERVRAFRFGVVDYITKPITREILLRKIERVLQDLDRRRGAVEASGAAASDVVASVQRTARSGLLTLQGQEGEARIVLQAGKVVEGSPALPVNPNKAAFQELDPRVEGIVTPSATAPSEGGLPSFSDLPEVFRAVLVVDDSDDFREFVRRLLCEQGLKVLTARDGEEGLKVALSERPWLIITDARMPRMDGFELCRAVRRHALIGRTPIIFLSGWDDYKQRYQALELGANEYLSKATPVRELLMRVHLTLARFSAMAHGKQEGMRGGLDVIGSAGLLQMCHLSQLTGVLTVRSGARLIEVRLRAGEIVGADTDRACGIEAVYELLGWTRGYFEFAPRSPEEQEPLGRCMEILLEGCRRLDEKREAQA
jgi:DNA-binding response OmpR family regulator